MSIKLYSTIAPKKSPFYFENGYADRYRVDITLDVVVSTAILPVEHLMQQPCENEGSVLRAYFVSKRHGSAMPRAVLGFYVFFRSTVHSPLQILEATVCGCSRKKCAIRHFYMPVSLRLWKQSFPTAGFRMAEAGWTHAFFLRRILPLSDSKLASAVNSLFSYHKTWTFTLECGRFSEQELPAKCLTYHVCIYGTNTNYL